jgi:hypothetical protein
MLGIYDSALKAYRPQPYAGRLMVWKTSDSSCDFRVWRMLSNEAALNHIPGDHMQVLEEPHIKAWAGPLAAELQDPGSSRDAKNAPTARKHSALGLLLAVQTITEWGIIL